MAVLSATIEKTLDLLLEARKYASVKDILSTLAAEDVAAILEEMDGKDMAMVFRLLPKELAADAFVELESGFQEQLIRDFSDAELVSVLDELYVSETVDIIEEMPANVVSRILNHVDAQTRASINQLLQYPEHSAGSIMTTEYVYLRPGMTVREAIERIRRYGSDSKAFYTCYVTENHRLIGRLSVKDLLLAKDEDSPIDPLIKTNVVFVSTHTDKEEVATLLKKYNFMAIPVVDSDERMVGIISFDDAIDVMEDEATEDMEIMAGMTPSDRTYLHESPLNLFRHRIGWLLFLMVSATFTGLIITRFEAALSSLVVLTAFIPMLMDTGGNCGSQSSVIIIRAIALGEVRFRDFFKVLFKELLTALLCGAVLAAVCFAKLMLFDRIALGNAAVTGTVALTVCLTMTVTVVVAKSVGCTLPLIARRCGFDPAVMASPLITTIADALSLIVYFSVASVLLF
ncbi:MAG: magnesium transporter [Treponema sp.]|nr:magnesium transporter [Treponema sp.]